MSSSLVINTVIILKFLHRLHFLIQQHSLSCPYLPAPSSPIPSPDYAGIATVQPCSNQGGNDPGENEPGSTPLNQLDHFPMQQPKHLCKCNGKNMEVALASITTKKCYEEPQFQFISQQTNFKISRISQATCSFASLEIYLKKFFPKEENTTQLQFCHVQVFLITSLTKQAITDQHLEDQRFLHITLPLPSKTSESIKDIDFYFSFLH